MSNTALSLRKHLTTHEQLLKLQSNGDHVGAGLSVTVCIGPSDARTAKTVRLSLADDTQAVLDMLVQAHRKTITLCAVMNDIDNKECLEAREAYRQFLLKHPSSEPVRNEEKA